MRNLFSKKKSTITLSKALELKDRLQERLQRNYNALRLENSVLKGQKRNYNLKKITKESDTLHEQLVQLKLIIQRSNLLVPEGETNCISQYVYDLSEKKATVLNLQSTLRKQTEGAEYEKPVFSRTEIEDWINKLRKECFEIERKLTTLNSSIIVELPFKTDLV